MMHAWQNECVRGICIRCCNLPELLSKKAAALVWVLKVPMVRSRGPMGIAHGRTQRPATIVGLGAQTARRSALGARRSVLDRKAHVCPPSSRHVTETATCSTIERLGSLTFLEANLRCREGVPVQTTPQPERASEMSRRWRSCARGGDV